MPAEDSDVSTQVDPEDVSSDDDEEQASGKRSKRQQQGPRKRAGGGPGGIKRVGASGTILSLGKYGSGLTEHCVECCGEDFKGPHVATSQVQDSILRGFLTDDGQLEPAEQSRHIRDWTGEMSSPCVM